MTADDLPEASRVDEATDALESPEQLGNALAAEEPLSTSRQRLMDAALKVVAGAHAVSVTVIVHSGQQPKTAAASHEWAVIVDKNQDEVDDDPCLEAARLR